MFSPHAAWHLARQGKKGDLLSLWRTRRIGMFISMRSLRFWEPGLKSSDSAGFSMGLNLSFPSVTDHLSLVIRWIYIAIAVVLSLLAIISFADIAQGFLFLGKALTLNTGILNILRSVLLTIIIVEILETVIIYFRTSRVLVRPILIAGLTAMVRRILFYGVEVIQPMDLLVDAVVIAVLTAAVVLVGKEESQQAGTV